MAEAAGAVADSAAAEPAADPQGVQPGPVSAKGPDEFTAKIRQGGDFAEKAVKDAQRELSRMKSKLGSVEQVVDAVGGSEPLLAHLRRLNTLVSNPKMREMVEHFEKTGEIAVPRNGAAEPTEEFEEPWDGKIKPIVNEVSTLKAELGKLRGERGVDKVRGFFQEFRNEFPLPDEDFKSLTAAMLEQSRQWSTTEQGRAALEGMNAETFRSLALSKLTKDQIRSALHQEEQALQARKAAAATDSPARGSTGRQRPEAMSVKDAFEQAARELGIDPRAPLL
jgi:hypothetical protein